MLYASTCMIQSKAQLHRRIMIASINKEHAATASCSFCIRQYMCAVTGKLLPSPALIADSRSLLVAFVTYTFKLCRKSVDAVEYAFGSPT